MVWSSDGLLPIDAFFLAIMIVVFLLESLIVAFLLNLILKTPLKSYLLSSMAVGLVVFLLTEATILFVPGPHVTYNSEPQNLQTWMVYNQGKINAIMVLIGLALWQAFVRNRRRV